MNKIDALKIIEVTLSHWREGLMNLDEVYNRIIDTLHESLLEVGAKKKELAEAFILGTKTVRDPSTSRVAAPPTDEEMLQYRNSRVMEAITHAVRCSRVFANASADEIRGMIEYALLDKDCIDDQLMETRLTMEGLLAAKTMDPVAMNRLLHKSGLRTGATILYVNGDNVVRQGVLASGYSNGHPDGYFFTLVDGTTIHYQVVRMVLKKVTKPSDHMTPKWDEVSP